MKQLYLSLAPGRCGTTKLAQILSLVPGMFAEHEADGPDSCCWVRQSSLDVQRTYIKRRLEFYNSLPYDHVANTTHMIGEGFYEHFVDLGIVPNIITMRRNPREVALSMWKLNWIPFRNRTFSPWYMGPDEPDTLPFPNYEKAHSYQLCYWWCCDTERRALKYTPWLKSLGAKVWETTLPQILDLTHINSMLDYFDLAHIDFIPPGKLNDLSWNYEHYHIEKSQPSDDYLNNLEQEVLNAIPADFKQHLQVVWKDYVAN